MVVAVAADAVPSFGSIATNNTQPPSDAQQTEQQQQTPAQTQTPQNATQSTTTPTTHTKKTNVDGKGMWRHWKRNFKNKLLALLDLIDNSLDAAVVLNNHTNDSNGGEGNEGDGGDERNRDFIGRVHIYPDEVDTSKDSIQSVMNNNQRARGFDFLTSDLGPSSNNNVTSTSSNKKAAESNNSGLVIVNNSYKPIQSMKNCLGAYNSSKVDSGSSDIGENVSFICLFVCALSYVQFEFCYTCKLLT